MLLYVPCSQQWCKTRRGQCSSKPYKPEACGVGRICRLWKEPTISLNNYIPPNDHANTSQNANWTKWFSHILSQSAPKLAATSRRKDELQSLVINHWIHVTTAINLQTPFKNDSVITNTLSHLAKAGFVTLLNSKHINLPPGLRTRRASWSAWKSIFAN